MGTRTNSVATAAVAVVVVLVIGVVEVSVTLLLTVPASEVSLVERSITFAIPSNKNPFGQTTVPDGGNILSMKGDIAVLLFM